MTIIEVSIIIINYNTWNLLASCIDSIQEHFEGVLHEIIVVDNASSDGSVEKIRENFPDVRLITNHENMGFAKANNQGAKVAHGEFLFLLNSDTLLTGPGLRGALDFMRGNDVAMLGPKILNEDGSLQPSFQVVNTLNRQLLRIASMVLRLNKISRQSKPESKPREVGFLLGAAMLINVRAVREVGLFDTQFFFNGEERDLCLRFLKAGKRIVHYPDWEIIHYGGGDAGRSPFHIVNWVKSTIKLSRKHGGAWQEWSATFLFSVLLLSNAASRLARFVWSRDKDQKALALMNYRIFLWHIGLSDEKNALKKPERD